jgi:hypothetical protein
MKLLSLLAIVFSFFFITTTTEAAVTVHTQLIQTYTEDRYGDGTFGIFRIQFSVIAGGDDIFIPYSDVVSLTVYRAATPVLPEHYTTSVTSLIGDYLMTDQGPGFLVRDGEMDIFEVSTALLTPSPGLYDVRLSAFNWLGGSTPLDPIQYKTPYIALAPPSVPEPSKMFFVGFGFAGLFMCRRR